MKDGLSSNYRAASSLTFLYNNRTRIKGHGGKNERKKQWENIVTERYVACSVNCIFIFSGLKTFLLSSIFWGSGTQACFRMAHFLKAQLQCHHRASKLLPLLIARFGEMDSRLCFLYG